MFWPERVALDSFYFTSFCRILNLGKITCPQKHPNSCTNLWTTKNKRWIYCDSLALRCNGFFWEDKKRWHSEAPCLSSKEVSRWAYTWCSLSREEKRSTSAYLWKTAKLGNAQLVCFRFARLMVLFCNQGVFQNSKTSSKERGSATKRKSALQKHKLHRPWLRSVVFVLMLGCKQHLLQMLGCKQCRLLRCPQWGLKFSQLQGEEAGWCWNMPLVLQSPWKGLPWKLCAELLGCTRISSLFVTPWFFMFQNMLKRIE